MLFPIADYQPLWRQVPDAHPAAFRLFQRHYNYRPYTDGRRQNPSNPMRHRMAGPGEYIILLGPDDNALFIWRRFRDKSGQQGINCAIFRNEGPHKSATLIIEAERWAWDRWPASRLYTYVHPGRIRSTNPGCCFKKAGWTLTAKTPAGLYVLAKEPTQ